MNDYIAPITGLVIMTANLPFLWLLFICIIGLLAIVLWKLPEIIHAVSEYKKAKQDSMPPVQPPPPQSPEQQN